MFCEKPLAITAVHADELATAARTANRVLTCHNNQRTRDYVATPRWLARHTPFMFDAETTWQQSRAKSGGGIFIGRGSHLIDCALHLLDFPRVETITATVSNRLTGYEVDDFAHVTPRLASGVTLGIECSYLAHLPAPVERLEWAIYGTRGGATFRLRDGQANLVAGRCDFPGDAWTDLTPQTDLPPARAAAPRSPLDDFIHAVLDRREPFVTGEQAAYVTRILEAGYRSADTGREVIFPGTGEPEPQTSQPR